MDHPTKIIGAQHCRKDSEQNGRKEREGQQNWCFCFSWQLPGAFQIPRTWSHLLVLKVDASRDLEPTEDHGAASCPDVRLPEGAGAWWADSISSAQSLHEQGGG